jgi:hypothetical protein
MCKKRHKERERERARETEIGKNLQSNLSVHTVHKFSLFSIHRMVAKCYFVIQAIEKRQKL